MELQEEIKNLLIEIADYLIAGDINKALMKTHEAINKINITSNEAENT